MSNFRTEFTGTEPTEAEEEQKLESAGKEKGRKNGIGDIREQSRYKHVCVLVHICTS